MDEEHVVEDEEKGDNEAEEIIQARDILTRFVKRKQDFTEEQTQFKRQKMDFEDRVQKEKKEIEMQKEEFKKEKKEARDLKLKQQQVVNLNVGGKHFTTYRSTLCAVRGSHLERMFSGRHEGLIPKEDGRFFLDLDGKLFEKYVLPLLRDVTHGRAPKIQVPPEEKSYVETQLAQLGLFEPEEEDQELRSLDLNSPVCLFFKEFKNAERKASGRDPHGFFARPRTKPNGSLDIMLWDCGIPGKPNTPWENALYPLTMDFSKDYPSKPPTCKFPFCFFHPNVYPSGTVAFPILEEKIAWKPGITVKQILVGVQDLLDNPNVHDPANSDAYHVCVQNKKEYNRYIKAQALSYPPS